MVKQRMSTADIAAEVACLRARGIVGMRCTNVYDISPKVGHSHFPRPHTPATRPHARPPARRRRRRPRRRRCTS
jgi:hypothetical protein